MWQNGISVNVIREKTFESQGRKPPQSLRTVIKNDLANQITGILVKHHYLFFTI